MINDGEISRYFTRILFSKKVKKNLADRVVSKLSTFSIHFLASNTKLCMHFRKTANGHIALHMHKLKLFGHSKFQYIYKKTSCYLANVTHVLCNLFILITVFKLVKWFLRTLGFSEHNAAQRFGA